MKWACRYPWRIDAALALGVVSVGAALRLWMLTRDVPTLDSDEATIGLMALHLLHGEWSTFFWGQAYMGSLEALLAAPLLALFGPSALTLRLAPLTVGLVFIVSVYLLGLRLYSRPVALASAALLACGSPFFVVLSVRAYGGYVETLLFGNALLLLTLHTLAVRQRAALWLALLGLVAGLALWTDMLIVPYLLAVGALFWWERRLDLLRRHGPALGAGLVLGAAPAILDNLAHGGATITTIAGLTLFGGSGSHLTIPQLVANITREALVSFPILVGDFLNGTQATGITDQEFRMVIQRAPVAYGVTLLLAGCVAALFLSAAVRVLRRRDALLAPAQPSPLEDEAAISTRRRLQAEAALLLVVALFAAAFVLTKNTLVFTTPRYLVPLFAATPLIVAHARRALFSPQVRRLAPQAGWRVGVAIVALFAVLAWNLAGDAAATPMQTAARDHSVWIYGQDRALLQLLRSHHVHTVITNDYWVGQRLTFESDEAVIAVMVTPEGHPGFNRYRPYVIHGLRDSRPAYIEITNTPEAQLHAEWLAQGRLRRYQSLSVDIYSALLPDAAT